LLPEVKQGMLFLQIHQSIWDVACVSDAVENLKITEHMPDQEKNGKGKGNNQPGNNNDLVATGMIMF
jgi:hypothetical protein